MCGVSPLRGPSLWVRRGIVLLYFNEGEKFKRANFMESFASKAVGQSRTLYVLISFGRLIIVDCLKRALLIFHKKIQSLKYFGYFAEIFRIFS